MHSAPSINCTMPRGRAAYIAFMLFEGPGCDGLSAPKACQTWFVVLLCVGSRVGQTKSENPKHHPPAPNNHGWTRDTYATTWTEYLFGSVDRLQTRARSELSDLWWTSLLCCRKRTLSHRGQVGAAETIVRGAARYAETGFGGLVDVR